MYVSNLSLSPGILSSLFLYSPRLSQCFQSIYLSLSLLSSLHLLQTVLTCHRFIYHFPFPISLSLSPALSRHPFLIPPDFLREPFNYLPFYFQSNCVSPPAFLNAPSTFSISNLSPEFLNTSSIYISLSISNQSIALSCPLTSLPSLPPDFL